jgi:hypothetical protein
MLRKQFALVLLNTVIGIAVAQAGAVFVSREELAKAERDNTSRLMKIIDIIRT